MEDFKELEYKYNANDISLSAFLACMVKLGKSKRVDVSSWVYYRDSKILIDRLIYSYKHRSLSINFSHSIIKHP